MRYTRHFEEVSITAVKRWKDETGKKRQETRKFYQTLNPYNKNADGTPKSCEQILTELKAERDAWLHQGLKGVLIVPR